MDGNVVAMMVVSGVFMAIGGVCTLIVKDNAVIKA